MHEKSLEGVHNCRRCGRVLKDEKSIQIGIGPICLSKESETKQVRLGGDLWDIIYEREQN